MVTVTDEMLKQQQATNSALNRLCKWRAVFAGWQLGTRAKGDAECDAVRDHREVTILLRAEVNALTAILFERTDITLTDFHKQLEIEAGLLERAYERAFPGFEATDTGITMYPDRARETTRNWPK